MIHNDNHFRKNAPPHPVYYIGLLSLLVWMMFLNIVFLVIGLLCISWWARYEHKPKLLARHLQNIESETFMHNGVEVSLSDCQLGKPIFHYIRKLSFPCVTQTVSALDPLTGSVDRFLIITKSDGSTKIHFLKPSPL